MFVLDISPCSEYFLMEWALGLANAFSFLQIFGVIENNYHKINSKYFEKKVEIVDTISNFMFD